MVSAGDRRAEGRGAVLLDLISHVERSVHDVRHVLPAIDHLAQLPPTPGPEDAAHLRADLTSIASPALAQAFERWCGCRQEFDDAAARLHSMRERADDPGFQVELERDIESFRATRAALLGATDELRELVVEEIDAGRP